MMTTPMATHNHTMTEPFPVREFTYAPPTPRWLDQAASGVWVGNLPKFE